MQDLIARLVSAASLSPDTAAKAVSIILAFLEQAGPSDAVAKLIDAIPGAREAANAGANANGDASLMTVLGDMMGHAGADIGSLGGQLMGIGLDIGQMQTIGQELFAFAAEKAGPDIVGRIVGEIPGLSQFV